MKNLLIILLFIPLLNFSQTEEIQDVPFSRVEIPPAMPGCEDEDNTRPLDEDNEPLESKRSLCTAQKITKFVQIKFNTDLARELGLSGRQRISVIFKINKNGDVIDIRARAPHPALLEEAKRVISMLPKMKPGYHKGKAVIVPYSLPIIFQVQD
jgi:periplasmic protein TonB